MHRSSMATKRKLPDSVVSEATATSVTKMIDSKTEPVVDAAKAAVTPTPPPPPPPNPGRNVDHDSEEQQALLTANTLQATENSPVRVQKGSPADIFMNMSPTQGSPESMVRQWHRRVDFVCAKFAHVLCRN